MRISGFSFCRNADSLFYPFEESIRSVLPIVDEYIMVVGKGNEKDQTLAKIRAMDNPKINVFESVWDLENFPDGMVHAQQTDYAKSKCTGDWLIYLQADEVLHEKDHNTILTACKSHLSDTRIEGFLFDYIHFWGDYHHHQNSHTWYDREIRVVRNNSDIHSWQSAQSFRSIPNFDGKSYRHKNGTRKLNVVKLNASIYHYGWVRPAQLMSKKVSAIYETHTGIKNRQVTEFGFGQLSKLPVFNGTHPTFMSNRISAMNWTVNEGRTPSYLRQNRFSARLLTWIEKNILDGKKLFTHHNYREIKP
ncbi:MAG: hypothetical protein Salg2KO_19550 [Salibacteraceae bacterium]